MALNRLADKMTGNHRGGGSAFDVRNRIGSFKYSAALSITRRSNTLSWKDIDIFRVLPILELRTVMLSGPAGSSRPVNDRLPSLCQGKSSSDVM